MKKARVDKRKVWAVVEGEEEPVIGLENVVEWWPGEESQAAPLYTCQICHGWLGWGGRAATHLVGDQHRRNQLVARYPALEEMIKDMGSPAVLERAKEETNTRLNTAAMQSEGQQLVAIKNNLPQNKITP